MKISEQALSFESIFTLAERESGAFGIADSGLRKRVAATIDWINERGPYSGEQLERMSYQIQQLLVNRLRLAADRKRYPAIADEKIERPIFVVGFARSGTTVLHALLAEDPDALSLKAWHAYTVSPPPGLTPVCAGRIEFAQRAAERLLDFIPSQTVMHPYSDKGAHQPMEDEALYGLDFRNMYPALYYRVPTLDVNVHVGNDPLGAVRFHHEVLQHLQWKTGKNRWVCKGVTAQHQLDAIFEVYPDARCVWAHRPLAEIYASNVAIRALTYDTIRGEPSDWSSQARESAQQMKQAYDRLMATSLIDDPRVIHLKFRELASDPVGTVTRIYERCGLSVGPEFKGRLQAWLDSPENKVDRWGRYPYSSEAFGLDNEWIRELFSDYSKRFGLVD